MYLSIIIPAYNENHKIRKDIHSACEFILNHNFSAEIIIVDDGSTDQTTEIAKQTPVPENISKLVITLADNKGKGFAVGTGIKSSNGEIAMFADSGCCVPFENALKGIQMINDNVCDIAHASRKMSGCDIKHGQSLYRRICSKLFRLIMVYYMKIPSDFTDTQCGFKIYKGDIARKLYTKSCIDGFMFDIEIIRLALADGYKIKEFPITWTCDRDSRLSPTKSSAKILKELLKIKKSISRS